MLSVLIPTYNYDIKPLIEEVYNQTAVLGIKFEIIVMDDASTDNRFDKTLLSKFSRLRLIELSENMGRSAVRNKLAKAAQNEWCLFIDADVIPVNTNFVETYINAISQNSDVINGGILYQEGTSQSSHNLRWVYGRKREALSSDDRSKKVYLSFLTLNFMIRKSVFEQVKFNEDIPNLRHEDTLFSYNLKEKNIAIKHINNPVYHLGLEDSKTFLHKSLQSVDVLNFMIKKELLPHNYTLISRVYKWVSSIGLRALFSQIYLRFKSSFDRHLTGQGPSLLIFDLYRLSYYCYINKQQ